MRKRALMLILAAVLLLGTGCQGGRKSEEAEYVLYFLANDGNGHGSALATEPYPGTQEGDAPEEQALPTPGELMQALLEGPGSEELASPFPRDVTLQWWEEDPEQAGCLRLGLSEQYSGLTDISLTLADYCIVLTMSQLEWVESVEIVSEGYASNYRSHQVLLPDEAVLTDEAAG